MKKHLFGVALLSMCLVCLGGVAQAQYDSIDDIQVYDVNGLPASPFAGQVVTVRGVVYERGQFSSGSHYIQGATGGISIYQTGSPVALGDDVEVTGTVGSFSGEIQLGTVTFTVLSSGNTVTPTLYDIADLQDYEKVGTLVSAIGTVYRKPNASNFFMQNVQGDTIQIYIDSTTGINLGAVEVGDVYQVTSPLVTFNGTIELKPRFQTDLVENPGGDTVPVISGITASNWVPGATDAVTIEATITDDLGVTSAAVFYRNSDGVTPGSWLSVPMSNVGGDQWAGTIPGAHTASQVDFYLQATDTGAQTTTLPGDAPAGFRTFAVGFTSIYDMQYAHPDSASQSAAYAGKFLNIRGVVTAGTDNTGAPSKFFVQEPQVNPATDSYAFGGVLVYETTGTYDYFRGDAVEIGGSCSEYFGMTEMIPNNADAVYLVGFGQELPVAPYVPTRTLADDVTNLGEAWEAVWVKTGPSAVMDTLGFGVFTVSSTGAAADTVEVDAPIELTYLPTPGDVVKVEGYMEYVFGDFAIRPIDDQFLVLTGATGVGDNVPTIMPAGGFKSIAPNPFNPATKIQFVVNRDNLVQLNIYNIRGEKIRTLVQDRLPASEYHFNWDGTDDAGQTVASGNYFARLRIGAEVTQVRKMSLIK
ncbi:MAG: FlgD immunoglobulin-like domain containing protein [bacterium]